MKTVFLDRDGVISIFTPDDYIKSWDEFRFLPRAFAGLKQLAASGYRIVVISNQAGVSKGLFSMESLNDITRRLEETLANEGIKIERFYYCIHSSEENCGCRKPRAGLLYRARAELGGIRLEESFFVGDTETDMQAGKTAGMGTILVLSGKTKKASEAANWKARPDFIAENIEEAAEIIIREDGKKRRRHTCTMS